MSFFSRLNGSSPTRALNFIATAKKQVLSINERIRKLKEKIFGSSIKLEDLPRDMLFEISKHLDTRTCLNVSQTSKGLNSQLKQLQIWQYIALEKGLIVPDDVPFNGIIDRLKEKELIHWQNIASSLALVVPDEASINEIKDLYQRT